jgi:NADH-quinone oxidoreductase subunit C
MDSTAIVTALRARVPGVEVRALASIDQPAIGVAADGLIAVCTALRDAPELRFTFLLDIIGVDRLPAEPRFEVNYSLVAPDVPARLRVKVALPGADPRVPTVTGVWPAAGFLEREVWDLMGIAFDGHQDLRRLLTPEDWVGHPLRKDYPVQIDTAAKSGSPLQMTATQFWGQMEDDRRARKGDA